MKPATFAEKIFKARSGAIVFKTPDLVLTHDNTASIFKTFKKMGGRKVADPDQMLVVLDHNAPPADAGMATQYQEIRNIVSEQGIRKFYDAGIGICHQIMSLHALPGMLIVGSDSHTTTAGAFNAFAAGIDRTESAGIWMRGETWFRVPESFRINLSGKFREGVYAKDLALWLIGILGADGTNYLAVEFHGLALDSLTISDRMTLANMASEMGAKNAVFPADGVLIEFLGSRAKEINPVWADAGAEYSGELDVDLNDILPVVASPHSPENLKTVSDSAGTVVHEGLIGTCTNGRIEDLRVAATVLRGRKIREGFQLNIVPASREVFLQAINEGLVTDLLKSGANFLTPSCGPCLGTGQGIPASGHSVISSANRNFPGRMGNKDASVWLASPATVAASAITGVITDPRQQPEKGNFVSAVHHTESTVLKNGEKRKSGNVWYYQDIDNLNTDQMFPGKHTYNVMSSEPEKIIPHLFEDFDPLFGPGVRSGDIIVAGENFGCGSSREHPSVGLAHAGIKVIIVKSVNRIFFRSSINQGLALIVNPQAVDACGFGDKVEVNFENGEILIGEKKFMFEPLPYQLRQIIDKKGLVNYIRSIQPGE